MKKGFRQILFYLVLIGIVITVCAALFNEPVETPEYTDIIKAFDNQDVTEAVVNKNGVLELTFKEGSESEEKWGKEINYRLASYSYFHADIGELLLEQQRAGILFVQSSSLPFPWRCAVFCRRSRLPGTAGCSQ